MAGAATAEGPPLRVGRLPTFRVRPSAAHHPQNIHTKRVSRSAFAPSSFVSSLRPQHASYSLRYDDLVARARPPLCLRPRFLFSLS